MLKTRCNNPNMRTRPCPPGNLTVLRSVVCLDNPLPPGFVPHEAVWAGEVGQGAEGAAFQGPERSPRLGVGGPESQASLRP